jgi:hypothetical protein
MTFWTGQERLALIESTSIGARQWARDSSFQHCAARRRASAGNLTLRAGAVYAPKRRAIGCRVPRDIYVCRSGGITLKVRFPQESKPSDGVEWRFHFVPLDARVFDPEAGMPTLAH